MVKGSGGSGRGGGGVSASARASIKALEGKGYNVEARPNMFLGVLDKEYPVVYDLTFLNENNTKITMGDGLSETALKNFAKTISPVRRPTLTRTTPTETVEQQRQRVSKARDWDRLYNEGGEGFNPYR